MKFRTKFLRPSFLAKHIPMLRIRRREFIKLTQKKRQLVLFFDFDARKVLKIILNLKKFVVFRLARGRICIEMKKDFVLFIFKEVLFKCCELEKIIISRSVDVLSHKKICSARSFTKSR